MDFRISDKVLLLKIRLAFIAEKLTDYGQENFASYIYTNINQLYNELDEIKHSNDAEEVFMRMHNVVKYLEEIENIVMACKMGVKLPLDENTLSAVRDVKLEIKELIRRQAFSRQITS